MPRPDVPIVEMVAHRLARRAVLIVTEMLGEEPSAEELAVEVDREWPGYVEAAKVMMLGADYPEAEVGSGNVFRDLGFAHPEDELAKAKVRSEEEDRGVLRLGVGPAGRPAQVGIVASMSLSEQDR